VAGVKEVVGLVVVLKHILKNKYQFLKRISMLSSSPWRRQSSGTAERWRRSHL